MGCFYSRKGGLGCTLLPISFVVDENFRWERCWTYYTDTTPPSGGSAPSAAGVESSAKGVLCSVSVSGSLLSAAGSMAAVPGILVFEAVALAGVARGG